MAVFRRSRVVLFISAALVLYFTGRTLLWFNEDLYTLVDVEFLRSSVDWAAVPHANPVESFRSLPTGEPLELPRVQHTFSADHPTSISKDELAARREKVRATFLRGWKSYRKLAWMYDELAPVSGTPKTTFGGWAATVVDGLDTLWIMGLTKEFAQALHSVAKIDWGNTRDSSLNVFETTIRHLGGLLSAYDLSHQPALLAKAIELGDLLYMSFDTPNRMPPFWLDFDRALKGLQVAGENDASAAVGTLSLEFTRLAQLTGNDKYFDAIDRIKDAFKKMQNETMLPGMWPIEINFRREKATGRSFTLGGRADSLYEYLPKMHLLLGGLDPVYKEMAIASLDTARDHLLFRPLTKNASHLLFSGRVVVPFRDNAEPQLNAEGEHLTCFAGGMYGLAGKIFSRDDYVDYGEQLARGCAWAYESFPTGLMPEVFQLVPCKTTSLGPCESDVEEEPSETIGKELPEGFEWVKDPRYILRPEAIESIFYAYRITGKEEYLDIAWKMFKAIETATKTPLANSAIADVKETGATRKLDSMESFWFSETLKYFYLIFSPPDVISLDDYVFNTEAHPLRRPKPGLKIQ
ncbi:hypothetical protein jhhlp_006382 [Lomentospora prolificans]|uniref:alpha-1,2-Mannosidase n=1 Tax=Lomentospora prolificans TaxID=41688 RepID=A0A2N3N5T9_9PEZI|nr:hypothetical protein jhhlp_006382 [Lomentospora prolificans]